MNLIIDVGNTTVKIGLFQNNKLLKKINYDSKNKNQLTSIFSDFPNINYVFFCGFNTQLKLQIQNIIDDSSVILVDWKNIKKDMINIEYDNLDSLGFDRLGLSVATLFLHPKFDNHLVIDIGSCITYDLVLNKKYQGGQISPGINIRLKSLEKFTTTLPKLDFLKPNFLLGKSTFESIQSGVFFGIHDEIKSRIDFYKKEITDLNIILTGGDALHFKKTIKNVVFDDNLLMKGLNLLLKYNVEK